MLPSTVLASQYTAITVGLQRALLSARTDQRILPNIGSGQQEVQIPQIPTKPFTYEENKRHRTQFSCTHCRVKKYVRH